MATLPADTDIVVLPELFSTGFIDDPALMETIAETNGGNTIHTITELARKYNVAIAGSMAARTGHRFYNRAFFIEPSGEETYYDKRHLFSLSSEAKVFTPGSDNIRAVRFRGWNIALAVCYDLRFPAWCRNVGLKYDIMLFPANWPEARGYAWKHLLIARAIENQAVVVGANRGGADDYGQYDGLTYIFDGMGMPTGHTLPDSDIVYAEMSLDDLRKARTRFPVSRDADDLSIL